MKNRKLLSIFIAIVMTGCLLAGCKNTRETHLPDTEETDTPEAESESREIEISFSFTDLSGLEFWYGSGAGAWFTVLTIHEDGSFEGEYQDSDMGTDYPIKYWCNFKGKFTEPVKVNDYTYSVKMERMELETEPDTEEIRDGVKYISSQPYGLDNAEELLFYLPGAPVEELPEEYRSWMMGYREFTDTQLPFYGLYNENAKEGFSSHEKAAIDTELAIVEEETAALENKLQTEVLSQAEMTETASKLYQLWDSELNAIWSLLKEKMDRAAMDTLTAEEREWIAYKETEIQKAGAEYEGGSIQSMAEYMRGAELTKIRVYELAEYLR